MDQAKHNIYFTCPATTDLIRFQSYLSQIILSVAHKAWLCNLQMIIILSFNNFYSFMDMEDMYESYSQQFDDYLGDESEPPLKRITSQDIIKEFERKLEDIGDKCGVDQAQAFNIFYLFGFKTKVFEDGLLLQPGEKQQKIYNYLKDQCITQEVLITQVREARLCGVCHNAGPGQQLNCGHFFCQECWDAQIQVKISQRDFATFCLQHGCHLRIPYEKLKLYPRFKEELAKTLILIDNNYSFCPEFGCDEMFERTQANQTQCSKSNRRSCFTCRVQLHDPLPCDIVQQWLKVTETEDNWLRTNATMCPYCNMMIQKRREHSNDEGGCNHIKCVCGGHFCFVCGKPWAENHDNFYECKFVEEGNNKLKMEAFERFQLGFRQIEKIILYYRKQKESTNHRSELEFNLVKKGCDFAEQLEKYRWVIVYQFATLNKNEQIKKKSQELFDDYIKFNEVMLELLNKKGSDIKNEAIDRLGQILLASGIELGQLMDMIRRDLPPHD